jgi:hypothetical protein
MPVGGEVATKNKLAHSTTNSGTIDGLRGRYFASSSNCGSIGKSLDTCGSADLRECTDEKKAEN